MTMRSMTQLLLAGAVAISSIACRSTSIPIDSNGAPASAGGGASSAAGASNVSAGTSGAGGELGASSPSTEASPLPQDPSKMIQGKPVFDVRLDIENCPHDVYVNGGLVERNLDPTPAHMEYQINQYLRSGRNEIEVLLVRMSKAPSECDVKLQLRYQDLSAPEGAEPITLFTLAHDAQTAPADDLVRGSSPSGTFDSKTGRASDGGDVRVGPASLVAATKRIQVLSRSLDIGLPFPQWAFLGSDKLKIYWQMTSDDERKGPYEELLARYNELHALLEKENIAAFLDACEERSRELDIAFYRSPGDTRRGLEHDLRKAMSDPKLELANLYKDPGKPWGYVVGSKGTLVALTQGRRASPIFRYQLKDGTPLSMIFPVAFRKEGSKFIISR